LHSEVPAVSVVPFCANAKVAARATSAILVVTFIVAYFELGLWLIRKIGFENLSRLEDHASQI